MEATEVQWKLWYGIGRHSSGFPMGNEYNTRVVGNGVMEMYVFFSEEMSACM